MELGSIAPCSGQWSLEDQLLELAAVGGVLLDLNCGRLQLTGLSRLSGVAAELLDDTPSGIGGFGIGAGLGGACKGCSVAFQREPRKGILSMRVLVCSTRFCNFFVSKASKSCCSVADISQYVFFLNLCLRIIASLG